jgi:hypothetical protein
MQPKKRLHTCGKRRFRDRVSAVLDMQRIQRKHDADRDKVPCRVYECPRCKGFHMTSQPVPEVPHAGA